MKFLEIRRRFSIKIDEIVGVEDKSDDKNQFLSDIFMKNGKIYRTTMNYRAILDLLEKYSGNINEFSQHRVG